MKSASRKTKFVETVASARLQRLRDTKKQLSDLEDFFVDEKKGKTFLQEVAHDYENIIYELTQTPIKKVRTNQKNGKHSGALAWTFDIVMLIMDMLIHGNPPTSTVSVILLCSIIFNKST